MVIDKNVNRKDQADLPKSLQKESWSPLISNLQGKYKSNRMLITKTLDKTYQWLKQTRRSCHHMTQLSNLPPLFFSCILHWDVQPWARVVMAAGILVWIGFGYKFYHPLRASSFQLLTTLSYMFFYLSTAAYSLQFYSWDKEVLCTNLLNRSPNPIRSHHWRYVKDGILCLQTKTFFKT